MKDSKNKNGIAFDSVDGEEGQSGNA